MTSEDVELADLCVRRSRDVDAHRWSGPGPLPSRFIPHRRSRAACLHEDAVRKYGNAIQPGKEALKGFRGQ